jgi:hypothetical protein
MSISTAVVALLILPIRIGLTKKFVRYVTLGLAAATAVSLWLQAYSSVMIAVADAVVVSAVLIASIGSLTVFFWSLSERKAHEKYPSDFIIDKLCQALVALERLCTEARSEQKPDASSNLTVNTTETGRKQVVNILKDVAVLLSRALPKTLAVSDAKMDAEILGRFTACAAGVRGVALAVAAPRSSQSQLPTLRRLFVSSTAEQWGDFTDLVPAVESIALEKRAAFGQTLLHAGTASAAIAGVYYLEVVKPEWLTSDFRNAVAVPLILLAIQQVVSAFDRGQIENGNSILRTGADILTRGR